MNIRKHITPWLLAITIAASCALAPACATLKNVLRTVDDVAVIACELFAQEHPAEFAHLVRTVLPAAAVSAAERDGFDPRALCGMKEIVQPFIDDQLRLQKSRATGLRAGMGGE